MDQLCTSRMRVSTVPRHAPTRGVKCKSVPLMEYDEDTTCSRIQRMPVAVLTDRWLKTIPGSEESRVALAELKAAARS